MMDKKYKIKRDQATRFSFAEFQKLCWQMSAKDDYHFIDFCRIFEAELKAIYLKKGLPIADQIQQKFIRVNKITCKEAKGKK